MCASDAIYGCESRADWEVGASPSMIAGSRSGFVNGALIRDALWDALGTHFALIFLRCAFLLVNLALYVGAECE